MQIFRNVYMVGGDDYSLSGTRWPYGDCCSYVLDTGEGLLLFDGGFEETLPEKLEIFAYWGLRPEEVRYVFVTHAHLDHFTAARYFQSLGAQVVASPFSARLMQEGNPEGADFLAFWAFQNAGVRPRFVPFKADIITPDGDIRNYAGVAVKSIHTEGPGHHHVLGPQGVSLFLASFEGRNILFSGDHILFERYGNVTWPDHRDIPLFESLQTEKIDAILGGHWFIHWRPWPREWPALLHPKPVD